MAGEQAQNKHGAEHLAAYQYKKGESGNLSGRPKGGKSLKEYARDKLSSMTDEEREEFLNGLHKETVWEMGEGKPKQDMELSGEVKAKIISVDE